MRHSLKLRRDSLREGSRAANSDGFQAEVPLSKDDVSRISVNSLYSMPVNPRESLDDDRELTKVRLSQAHA